MPTPQASPWSVTSDATPRCPTKWNRCTVTRLATAQIPAHSAMMTANPNAANSAVLALDRSELPSQL
jgi:hypothetical protein